VSGSRPPDAAAMAMTRPEGSRAAPDGPQRSGGWGGTAILVRDAKAPWRRRKIAGPAPLRGKRGASALYPLARSSHRAGCIGGRASTSGGPLRSSVRPLTAVDGHGKLQVSRPCGRCSCGQSNSGEERLTSPSRQQVVADPAAVSTAREMVDPVGRTSVCTR